MIFLIPFIMVGLILRSEASDVTTTKDLLSRLKRTPERDPYVFNLFEVILTTLETKLRRVENMDKALEHLVRRLDLMEGQLSLTLNTTSKMVHLLDVRLDSGCFRATETVPAPKQVTRVVRHRPYTGYYFESDTEKRKSPVKTRSPSNVVSQRISSVRRLSSSRNPDQVSLNQPPKIDIKKETKSKLASDDGKMEQQLDEVVKRVTMIDTKLSTLQEQLDTNTITRQTEELMASASESYRIGIGLGDRLQAVEKQQDLGQIEASVEDMRNSLESVNRRLQAHAESSSNNLDKISGEVSSLKISLIDLSKEREMDWCVNKRWNDSSSNEECVSPFMEVYEKSDKIMTSMVTPQDLELLDTKGLKEAQAAQGSSLEDFKIQMDEKSTQILKNLQEVKKDLRRLRLHEREGALNRVNPVALLQKTTGSSSDGDNVAEASSPPSDILDQRVLSESNASSENDSSGDRARHAGVIFPQKHKKPVDETAFIANSLDNEIQGYSCLDLLKKGEKKSGTYHLKIRGTTYWFLQVYCDMTTAGGGWTVIQRRDDFPEPRESFNRGWSDYKHGFGHPERELWLGNENIYMLTNTEEYVLRVELEDFDGSKRFAEYSTFKLHDENDLYKLEIGGYNGSAGDALNDPWYGSNLSPFSTMDKDNDRSSLNCASMLKGGWWWRSCGRGLNGLYITNPNDFTARQGIVWFRWRGWDYTLKRTVLMIRPKVDDEEEGIS